ncbi:hypothetical protein SLEP1_g43698 [Rubroshorea leprosula]|uniref:Uncharacterized protein n=1 Tax=Rubroshorea leprosula TaxID=152421 RepID=A0AAV5LDU1_9ROSI|nr:hypothetical protein SLEP1_g43698 [Rubroshorea leprosula]
MPAKLLPKRSPHGPIPLVNPKSCLDSYCRSRSGLWTRRKSGRNRSKGGKRKMKKNKEQGDEEENQFRLLTGKMGSRVNVGAVKTYKW